MNNRITPYNITELRENEIFVFESNLSNFHGSGAAKQALKWGAKYGKGGLQGRTYALPTKSNKLETLSLDKIQTHVNDFIIFAQNNPDLTFLCTAIGTGLAGYKAYEIAPLFQEAKNVENIYLPQEFWNYLL